MKAPGFNEGPRTPARPCTVLGGLKGQVQSAGAHTALCRAFIHMVEKIPRHCRLEGCHRMFAAKHLICGLESV